MSEQHTYSVVTVPVSGGELTVGVWEPVGEITDTIVAIHGVTASHLAWMDVVPTLPGVRIIAPDLRGRGRSNQIDGPAGMAAHAADIIAVMDAFGLANTTLVGHSMGAFVSVVTAYLHPDRISRLVLIDGGLPLDVPAGLSAEELVQHILGPTAARLDMRFASVDDYLALWRAHPAFANAWTPALEQYLAYDLVPDGSGALRPATSYAVTVDDTVDLNTGSLPRDAVAGISVSTVFVWVPRGLQNETPGLYSPEQVARLEEALPSVRFRFVEDLNHYTIVMSDRGASAVAPIIAAELAELHV